jgi:hypothetical protein
MQAAVAGWSGVLVGFAPGVAVWCSEPQSMPQENVKQKFGPWGGIPGDEGLS